MKKQSLFLFVTLVAFTAFFVSCKKQDQSHNNNTTSLQCRIINMKTIGRVNSEIILSYNSNKKLSSVIYTLLKKQDLFTYSNNLIIKKELDSNGNLSVIDSITLGANSLVSTVVSRSALTGKVMKRDTMFYNAQNQIIKGYGNEYGWVNGDALTIAYGGRILMEFYYDTSKSPQNGDYLQLRDMLTYAAHVFLCRHLCVGEGDVRYTFDNNGKIISEITNYGADSTIFDYTCD